MEKVTIGVLAFAAGAVAGGLFVKWYVQTHAGGIAAGKLGESLFGEGSTGAKILGGIGGAIDEVRG